MCFIPVIFKFCGEGRFYKAQTFRAINMGEIGVVAYTWEDYLTYVLGMLLVLVGAAIILKER